jgi:hypothetical protein
MVDVLTFQERVRRRTEALRAEIESLVDQTRLLEAELTRLKAAEEVYTSMMQEAEQPEAEPSAASPDLTLADAIGSWMTDHGGFGRVAAIYKDLWKAGRLRAKNPKSAYTQVYSALKRHDGRFREIGGGMWALVGTKVVDTVEVDTTNLNRLLNDFIADAAAKSRGSADWGPAEAMQMPPVGSAVVPESAQQDV